MCRKLLFALLLIVPLPLAAQAPPLTDEEKALRTHLLANYTKFEHQIPMRDGVRLFTVVYVPKDTSKTWPIMLNRTPYGVGPYGVDQYPNRLGPSHHFLKAGYIFVSQDVRGRMKSEGKFVDMRPHNPDKKSTADTDESSDTFDTIDWLVRNVPGHNGKVGMSGISYPGFYAACALIDSHPALKAVSPQAPVMDFFDGDDWRHNGALLLTHNFGFETVFSKMSPKLSRRDGSLTFDYGTPDGYKFFLEMGPLANADAKYLKGTSAFWNDVMKHETYDEFCKSRNLKPHVKNVKPAVLTVGGWYDAEDLGGAVACHQRVAANSPECPQSVLVMGPWVHGGWSRTGGDALGAVKFNANTSDYYRDKVEFPFFEHHLKGTAMDALPKAALVFETGTNRWRRFDTWPPQDAERVSFFLDPNQSLAMGKSEARDESFDEFVSDPAKPVPYVEKTVMRMDKEYMTADQRFAGRRTDVLTYQTPVLTQDLMIAGPIEVELHVSTTGTDADWVVKLIDVYPDDYPDPDPNPSGVRMAGYQQLVRGEPFRGKFRNSLEKPEPFEPGKPVVIKFTMPDVSHAFRTGHRVMVQVQSSWFPFIDRNPQIFCDIATAKESDFRKATHRVYHSPSQHSSVTVRVVK